MLKLLVAVDLRLVWMMTSEIKPAGTLPEYH